MIENSRIGVIILAAGSSSRLGYAKQLVKFRGKTLIQHAMKVCAEFNFDTKILVLGSGKENIENKIDSEDFMIVQNKNWQEGMASSIRKGIAKIEELPNEVDHVLILLSDQPFVNKDKLQVLIKKQLETNSPATFCEYVGDVGVPAIFQADIFKYLKELQGDHGAKKLILEKKFDFETVKFEKGNFDVDTAEDVELLKKLEGE